MKTILSSEVPLIIIVTVISSGFCHDLNTEWCLSTNSYDAYDKVLQIMGVTEIKKMEVDRLINTTFTRAGCASQLENSNFSHVCSQCLRAEHVYQALQLPTGSSINKIKFYELSIILLTFISDLSHWCPEAQSLDWNNVTIEFFEHELLELENSYPDEGHSHEEELNHEDEKPQIGENHEDHDGHSLQIGQLEYLLRHLAETFIPGSKPYLSLHEAERTDFIQYICIFQNIASFSSGEVVQLLNASNPEQSIDEEDLGRMSGIIIAKLLSGECIRSVEKGVIESEEFMRSLFQHYSDPETCLITNEGLEAMATSLNIGGLDEHDHAHDQGNADHDHDHEATAQVRDDIEHHNNVTDSPSHANENHSNVTQGLGNVTLAPNLNKGIAANDDNLTFTWIEEDSKRKKRDTHGHDHDEPKRNETNVNKMCFSIDELVRSIKLDPSNLTVTRNDMIKLCPVLLQQALQGCPASQETVTFVEDTTTVAQAYGYGTIAVIIVSFACLFGLIIVKWQKTSAYRYIMTLMLGLGVSALIGDALLHLIPHALGMHDHEAESGHDHAHESTSGVVVEPFLWKLLCACGSIWFYYNLQLLLHVLGEFMERRQKMDHGVSMVTLDNYSERQDSTTTLAHSHNNHQTSFLEDTDAKKYRVDHTDEGVTVKYPHNDKSEEIKHSHTTAAWMITFGDAIHNFADGLAMGAAFSRSWKIGLSTTIAIFVHEIPHEFGDIAIMLSSGWSVRKVIICQLASQATAFIGLFIGISVSESTTDAQLWIFSVTCGLFLYISLANIIPEIVEYFAHYNKLLVCIMSNLGIAIGFAAMLLIAIYEERIAIN